MLRNLGYTKILSFTAIIYLLCTVNKHLKDENSKQY